jgi:(p)ppGpp synthase/HD superfamily hydrolase
MFHVIRVTTAFLGDPLLQKIALLHDVVEDSPQQSSGPVTLRDIERWFGPEVSDAIDALSRRAKEPYLAGYIRRLGVNPHARRVKLADLRDNMSETRMRQISENPGQALSRLRRYQAASIYLRELDKTHRRTHESAPEVNQFNSGIGLLPH